VPFAAARASAAAPDDAKKSIEFEIARSRFGRLADDYQRFAARLRFLE
jgi:hypothetical protein